MRTRAIYVTLAITLMAVGLAYGSPDPEPWPTYSTHTDYVGYVQVLPTNTSGTTWEYSLTVLIGSYEPGHGGVAGIKGIAVYPNGGDPEPALDGWTDYAMYVRPGWNDNGGWTPPQGAFGYITGSPTDYILPGQANQHVGSAAYPTGYVPPNQVFLVHVACNDDYTYWARPTIIPEPSSLSILGIGLLPLARLMGRKRR